jgi:formate-dependent nitrite reductase membrane component NrfD
MTEIELFHKNPLTPLGPAAWHWEVAVYLFLGGVTAGLMILNTLLAWRVPSRERSRWGRWLLLAAPVLISFGMLALFLDLETHTRAYRFYLAFEVTSPMSWGAWILLLIYPVTLLLGLGQLTDDEARWLADWKPVTSLRLGALVGWAHRWGAARLRGLQWTNLLAGIALGTYTGILLGTLGARAAWNSAILGPLFLVSGVSTGAAMMMLFPLNPGEHRLVRTWDLGAIVVELALLGIFLLGLVTGGAGARSAGALLTGGTGSLTAAFWSLVVVAGLVVPLAIEGLEARFHLRSTRLAPVLLLVGGLSLRWILVIAGQTG